MPHLFNFRRGQPREPQREESNPMRFQRLTKERILAVRKQELNPRARSHLKMYKGTPTRFQILPVPCREIDRRWHHVYQGKLPFIKARGGIMLITADLEAMLNEQNPFRPSKARYMVREEVLDTMTNAEPPEHDGNPRRVPTLYRVLWRPVERPTPGEPPAGLSHEQLANWHLRGATWRRIYYPGRDRWLFIEVSRPIFTKAERTFDPQWVGEHKLARQYQGVVRIAFPYDVLSGRADGDEIIKQD